MAHINAKTILESLTEPNPFLHEQQPKSKSNTSSEDFLDLDITEVEEWQDFTYENLFAAFSDILLENTKYQDNWPGDNTRPNPRQEHVSTPFRLCGTASCSRSWRLFTPALTMPITGWHQFLASVSPVG